MTLSESQAFGGSLMFYNSAKNAKKSKVQKAETIYNDLQDRFPGHKKETPESA